MKHFAKMMLCVLALVSLTIACSDDDKEETPVYGEAKMLSFGFYADDNEGILLKDYTVDNIGTSASIRIELPEEVDKSALIARFTTTENDVVTVNGVAQVSGVTANNFTNPVDYLVTEGTNNTRYTVTVGKLPDAVWAKLATFNEFKVNAAHMKVSPKTREPYLVFIKDEEDSANERLGCVSYTQTGWNFTGSNGVASTTRPNSYIDFTFNKAGNPYIVFGDRGAEVVQSASVVAYNGTSWNYVGNSGITAGIASYNSIAMVNDQPMIFTMNNTNKATYRRYLLYNIYNGSAWSTDAPVPNRPAPDGSAYASYNSCCKVLNSVVYLGVQNVSKAGIFSVYTYDQGAWNTLYEGGDEPIDADVTGANIYDFGMDVDKDGNIYVIYAAVTTTSNYNLTVKKYTASTQKWSTVGGAPLQVTNSNARYYEIAVSPYGQPFVLYRNDSKNPTVVAFDEESRLWGEPLVLDTFEDEDLSIDFAEDGIGYLSYRDPNGSIVLWKYDIPQE